MTEIGQSKQKPLSKKYLAFSIGNEKVVIGRKKTIITVYPEVETLKNQLFSYMF
jgi:hypothetical protein